MRTTSTSNSSSLLDITSLLAATWIPRVITSTPITPTTGSRARPSRRRPTRSPGTDQEVEEEQQGTLGSEDVCVCVMRLWKERPRDAKAKCENASRARERERELFFEVLVGERTSDTNDTSQPTKSKTPHQAKVPRRRRTAAFKESRPTTTIIIIHHLQPFFYRVVFKMYPRMMIPRFILFFLT